MSVTEVVLKVVLENGVKGVVWVGKKAYENLIGNNKAEPAKELNPQPSNDKNLDVVPPLEENIVIPPTEALNLSPVKEKALIGKGGEMDGYLYLLNHTPIGIGRDPAQCNIVYPPETRGISRLHCQLIQKGNNWYLVDRSTCGTWMRNRRLKKGRSYLLKPGDNFFLASAGSKDSFMFQEVTL